MPKIVDRFSRGELFPIRPPSGRPSRWPVRILAAAVGCYLFYLFVFSDQGLLHILALRQEMARMESHSTLLASKVKIVDEELQRVRTDPFYTEKFIREKTGMVKPGEIVYRVVPESVAAEAVQARALLPQPSPTGAKTSRKLVWDSSRLK